MKQLLGVIIGVTSIAVAGIAGAVDSRRWDQKTTGPNMRPIQVVEMQQYQGPQDTPDLRSRNEAERLLAPHIAAARRSLPAAKQRFLKGLPRGSTFFVTIAVQDGRNKENAYVKVERWNTEQITGVMATELRMVRRHKMGDRLVVSENDVIDWTITSERGDEEGNFIGKFLDSREQ